MREYIAQGRYGYIGIDEYKDGQCMRTVITGIKPLKLGREIASHLNAAYQQGRKDAADEAKADGKAVSP